MTAAPATANGRAALTRTFPAPLETLSFSPPVLGLVLLELTTTVADASVVEVNVLVEVATTVVTVDVERVVGTTTTSVLVLVTTVDAGTIAVAGTVVVVVKVEVSAVLVSPPPPNAFTVVEEKVVVGEFVITVVPSETLDDCAKAPVAAARRRGK